MNRVRGAAPVALALLALLSSLAPATAAGHAHATLPLDATDEPMQDALTWMADQRVNESGCALDDDPSQGECSRHWTMWFIVTVAHAGLDPAAWPSEDANLLGWLSQRTDDLRDQGLRDCQQDEDTSEADCADERVFNLVKAILAFRAADRDPRAIDLPNSDTRDDGDTRDLVAELLDQHTGDEFGRSELANDDIWALIALNSVGYNGPEIDDAIERTEAAQGPGGGVSHRENQLPNVDTTAEAIQAVAPHGRDAFLSNARSYLADTQTSSGDRRGCWSQGSASLFSDHPNAESTARALQAIAALGEDPLSWSVDGQSPPECLLTFQDDGGGFRHVDNEQARSTPASMPTQQTVAALPWIPYGALTAPAQDHSLEDTATEGRSHEAEVPDGFVRVDRTGHDSYDWTPEETGTRVFHGLTWTPYPRPATLTVQIQAADDSGGSSGSGSSGAGTGGEHDAGPSSQAPEVALEIPSQAERNVTTRVRVNATAGDAPVTGLRVDWGDGEQTDWQATPTFSHTYEELGMVDVTAWARDANGTLSEPAEASLEVVDARPRLSVQVPSTVLRLTPVPLNATAHDPDGPPPTVTWALPDSTLESPNVTATFQAPGTHAIQARAADGQGPAVWANATLEARNRPPTNLTVTPLTTETNTTAVLRANATDPESDPLTFTWSLDDERSWGRQLHLETGSPGERTLQINVSDGYGGWQRAEVTLQVQEASTDEAAGSVETVAASPPPGATQAPDPPEGPDGPAHVELPTVLHGEPGHRTLLTGRAHQPNGTVTTVEVTLGEPVPVHGTERFQALVPPLPNGTYELAARAAGVDGSWGPWTNATLIVEPAEPLEPLDAHGTEEAHEASADLLLPLAALSLAAWRRRR